MRSGWSGGWLGDTLKISFTAILAHGKPNQAVIALLVGALRPPKSTLGVVRGETQASKLSASLQTS